MIDRRAIIGIGWAEHDRSMGCTNSAFLAVAAAVRADMERERIMSERKKLEQKVVEILTGYVRGSDVPDVTLDTPFKDLTMDSLDVVEACMSIEEEYRLEIEDDALETVKTGRDVANYVQGRLRARAEAEVAELTRDISFREISDDHFLTSGRKSEMMQRLEDAKARAEAWV